MKDVTQNLHVNSSVGINNLKMVRF